MKTTRIDRESGWNEMFNLVLIENQGGRDYYEIARWDTYPVDGDIVVLAQYPATEAGLEDALRRVRDLAFVSRIDGIIDTTIASRIS